MLICLPFDNEKIYAFWCRNYKDIKYEDYMKIGYEEFIMKLNSIPKNEPFYDVIKSRAINLNKIKDKEERKYWREMKRVNAIPDLYKPIDLIYKELKEQVKSRSELNGNKFS